MLASVTTACLRYLTMTEVHVSYSTNKCVRIVKANGEILPCSKLKELDRYERVWVE